MSSINMVSILGLGTLTSAVVIFLLFSRFRHWIMAMFAGMAYWSILEAICYSSNLLFNLSTFEGLLVGVTLTIILLTIWLAVTENERKAKQQLIKLSRQIEHTPVDHKQWHTVSRYSNF